jgi:hypothetical protein
MRRHKSARGQLRLKFPVEPVVPKPTGAKQLPAPHYVPGAGSVLFLVFGDEKKLRKGEGKDKGPSILPRALDSLYPDPSDPKKGKAADLADRPFDYRFVLTAREGIAIARTYPDAEIYVLVDYEHSPSQLDELRKLGEEFASLRRERLPATAIVFVDGQETKLCAALAEAVGAFVHHFTRPKNAGSGQTNWKISSPQHPKMPFRMTLGHLHKVLAQNSEFVHGE